MKNLTIGIFLSSVLLGNWVFAEEKSGRWRINDQREVGLSLTPLRAREILRLYNFKSINRVDYYIDIFNGQDFLLGLSKERFKLRLKDEKKEGVVQASTLHENNKHQCPNALVINLKRKSVGELYLKSGERKFFADMAKSQMDFLREGQLVEAANSLKALDSFIRSAPVPYLEKIISFGNGERWYFAAGLITRKVKSKVVFKKPEGAITVSITEGEDFLGSSPFQRRYEIEIQADPTMSESSFAHYACEFISSSGVSVEDIPTDRKNPEDEVLGALKKVSRQLGL